MLKHCEFTVGLKARQHARRMIVVEEFTTKFEVELVAKLSDTLLNVFGLNFNVFVVVEAVFHNFQIVRMQIKIRGTNLVFFSLIANIRRK